MSAIVSLNEPLLTEAEVAELLKIKTGQIRHLRRSRQIPFVRIGHRTVRYRRADVCAFLEDRLHRS